nr:MAG TPA: hypothetical protein [Caudoviricetes sp.]
MLKRCLKSRFLQWNAEWGVEWGAFLGDFCSSIINLYNLQNVIMHPYLTVFVYFYMLDYLDTCSYCFLIKRGKLTRCFIFAE